MAGKGSAPGERRGGRQKGSANLSTREMKAIFQKPEDAEMMKAHLMAIAGNDKLPANHRVMAIHEFFDRGFGKATTPIKLQEGTGRWDWSRIPDDKLKLVDEVLRIAQTDGVVIDHDE